MRLILQEILVGGKSPGRAKPLFEFTFFVQRSNRQLYKGKVKRHDFDSGVPGAASTSGDR